MPWLATHDEVCHGQRPVDESMPWPEARGWKYAKASSPKTKVCHGHKLVDESMPWMESGRWSYSMVTWPSNLITFQFSFYLCHKVLFNRCIISIGLPRLRFLCNYFVGAPSNSMASGVNYSQVTDGCSCWGFILRHEFPLGTSSFL